ncbi:MAG: xylulokinase [Firmicutes bacterium]|nr:xylulokinase [Bacillota bacterium]
MSNQYILGIDIGTSGTKTVLFTAGGEPVCAKTVEYPLYQPKNGWAEQEPEDWWNAVREGVSAVIAESGVRNTDIASVGLSGQMHGLVMLDGAGEVLRRSIIWCDQRTAAQCEEMTARIGQKRLIELTANPALTGFTASKILWVQEQEPERYEKCAHILLPKDYIRYKLTGEFATEVSDASGMQLMDVPARTWSGEILDKMHIDRALLAKLYESPEVTGAVHAAAAAETGLAAGAPVVGGAGDNAAAAVGMGVVTAGSAFTSLGSSGVIYAVSDKVAIDPEGRVNSLCASAPGKWTVMSCTQAAGLSLKWFRDNFCQAEIAQAEASGTDSYILLDKLAAAVPIGSEALLYLPYLMGERAPHPDPDCRGVFFGLSAKHGRAQLYRAVLEGVAYSQKECVDVFSEMGVQIGDMLVTGGGGRSALWRQMLADLYGCPIHMVQADEGPALGAAILGAVGAGLYGDLEEACGAVVRRRKVNEPIPENSAAYRGYFELYKSLYRSLRGDFKTLAALGK